MSEELRKKLQAINFENRRYWAVHAIVEARTRAARAADEAHKQAAQAVRRKGTQRSAEARKNKNIERDRKIHDAYAAGKKPYQIARKPEFGNLCVQQVRKILRKPRP